MKSTTYLLIGGGLASFQAAKLIRMKDPDGPITLVSREDHPPYDRPPLSKDFLRGETSVDDITYEPLSYYEEHHIELLTGFSVTALDPDNKRVTISDGTDILYGKALIATGGEPTRLDVPGADLDGVHYLRSLPDAQSIRAAAGLDPGDSNRPTVRDRTGGRRRAVVVGGGFIGLETAASLTQMGVHVTVIEAQSHVWAEFAGAELAGFIQQYCSDRGITFHMGDVATAFRGRGAEGAAGDASPSRAGADHVATVVTQSGEEIPCDFVCVGIGIRPETALADAAGIFVNDGIIVNEFMQTSHPDVYAAGDVIRYPDPVFGIHRRVEHWGHAEYTGQIAGLNMSGAPQRYDMLTYVWSDIFDLHVEFAGNEKAGDTVLVRGHLGTPPFTVLYLQGDVLTAYFAVNTSSREFPKMQKLIRKRVDLAGRANELVDPDFELKTLP